MLHQKFEPTCPFPDHRPYIRKIVAFKPLVDFKQILPKTFPLDNHAFLEKAQRNNITKYSVQQDYLLE